MIDRASRTKPRAKAKIAESAMTATIAKSRAFMWRSPSGSAGAARAGTTTASPARSNVRLLRSSVRFRRHLSSRRRELKCRRNRTEDRSNRTFERAGDAVVVPARAAPAEPEGDRHMNALDFAIVAVIALSAIFAFARGFVREALSIIAWVGAAAAPLYG